MLINLYDLKLVSVVVAFRCLYFLATGERIKNFLQYSVYFLSAKAEKNALVTRLRQFVLSWVKCLQ